MVFIMLYTVFGTLILKPIFMYMKKKELFICLFPLCVENFQWGIPLVVHCQNCGIFITEEFAMFKQNKKK